jgi:tRNA(Ile)-lysidine synthase
MKDFKAMADGLIPRRMPSQIAVPDSVNPCLAGVHGLLCCHLEFLASPAFRLGVAFSGGADSTALLHALAFCIPGRLVAIHVHHGLQPLADAFVSHCEEQCASLNVPLHVAYVNGKAARGESPEEAARKARYAALSQAARELSISDIALAQHADDQVETLLLALTRGAGLPGLAAMPERFERHGVMFHRPLLSVASQAIRRWLLLQKISFVQDPSNADEALTRNRIRKQILPVLEKSFPGFRSQFARSARHAAQGKRLLETLAASDLAQAGSPPKIKLLQQLSLDRQANALRYWLKEAHSISPSDAQLQELIKQVHACSTRGHRIRLKIGTGQVRREDEVLVFGHEANC